MRMRSLFIILSVFVLSGAPLYGQSVGAGRAGQNSGTYSVSGKVVLPNGRPAAGVRVDVSCDFTNVSATTDSTGTYLATGVPAGNCSISVKVPGLSPAVEYRTITRDTPQGQAVYVPIFLKGDPFASSPMFEGVPKSALEKFKAGMEKADKGDHDAAISDFDQATTLHPGFATAWYYKGNSWLKKGDADKAVASFVKAIEIKPDYLEAKYGFGLAQMQKKNYEICEAVFRDVLKQRSDMPEAHLNLGISLYYLKNLAEAEREMKAATASKSGEKLALGHLYLGQIYSQTKRSGEAVAELKKYLEIVPKAPNADRVKETIENLKKQQ